MKRILLATAAFAAAVGFGSGGWAQPQPQYRLLAKIPIPDGGWDYSTFDDKTRTLYTAKGDFIIGLQVDSGTVLTKVASAEGSHAPVPLPGDRLMITNGRANDVTIVSARTGKVESTIPTGKGPDGAIYDVSSKLGIVADHAGGEVVLIDPREGKAVGQIMVGGVLEFVATDGEGHAFVNVEDQGKIAKIDLKAKTLMGVHPIDGCEHPSGLAYAAAAKVLIAACGNEVAAAIDPSNGKTLKTLPIGAGPDAVMYDPSRKLAFVPAGRAGTLTVIDASGPDKVEVVQTVATMGSARLGAVDPRTGRIYLPAAQMGPPSQPNGRPAPVPGTAVLLVVGPPPR